MKIDSTGGYTPVDALLQRGKVEAEAHKTQEPQGEKQLGEKVEISSRAREIQRIKAMLEEMPEVRLEKVEELKAMIQKGEYKVDLDGLSEKLVEALVRGEL
jgi:negative regulator of flagellin synthesis FlgM